MSNPDRNARTKLTRRDFLKAALVAGGSLVVDKLLSACSRRIAQAPPVPTNTPFPTPPLKETPIPPKPVTITADLLTSGLTGIGGDTEAMIPIPTRSSTGGTKDTVPFVDTYSYAKDAWLWDRKSQYKDLATDPIKALQYFIALTAMSLPEEVGTIDFQKLFSGLPSPLVLEKLTIDKLPGNNALSAIIDNAKPQGLEINKKTRMIVAGRYTDTKGHNQVVVAFDDFLRTKGNSPRLLLAVLPETKGLTSSSNNTTSFADMIKQNGWDYDWTTGTITLPNGKQLFINQIDPSFANQISDAAGALYVNKRPDGGVYFNPVVPYPPQALRAKAVSGYTVQNGQPIGMDLNNNAVIQASYDGGSDTWNWAEIKKGPPTLRQLAEKIKVDGETFGIGTTVDLGESSHTNPLYLATASKQFNLLTVAGGFMQQYIDKYNGARIYSDFAQRNDMRLRIHPLFWHQDVPDNLQSAGKTEVVDYMQKRIKDILKYVKPGSNTQIVLANEAFWFANGNGGYVDTSPFFKAFGKDWIAEAYVMVHNIASSADFNLKLGDDFTLMVNDFGIETPGPKAEIVLQELQRTKQIIANRLNMNASSVQLNLGLQFHLGQSRGQYEYRVPPSAVKQDVLIKHFKRMSQIGHIDLTEIDALIDDEDKKANTIRVLVQSALQSGVCQSICFWGDLAFDPNRPEQRTLFSSNFQPTASYNAVQKVLTDFTGTNS